MLASIVSRIEATSGAFVRVVRWWIIGLLVVTCYDVGARYLFASPTQWAFELTIMLGGSLIVLGAPYVTLINRHVRVDFLYDRWSRRTRQFVDTLGFLVFFFPMVGFVAWASVVQAIASWQMAERSSLSYWEPPIYPFKTAIAIGLILLFLQGVATFIRHVAGLRKEGRNGS